MGDYEHWLPNGDAVTIPYLTTRNFQLWLFKIMVTDHRLQALRHLKIHFEMSSDCTDDEFDDIIKYHMYVAITSTISKAVPSLITAGVNVSEHNPYSLLLAIKGAMES